MKKIAAMILALATLVLTGCAKEGTGLFKGNYSFKTSGTLVLFRTADGAADPDPIVVSLNPESGQMDITGTGDGDGMIVTMNVIGGDMLVFRAKAEGKELVIEPTERRISLTVPRKNGILEDGPSLLSGIAEATVTVSGSGERFEDIVLFDLEYKGRFEFDGGEYEITDSNVNCRGKLNVK